MTKLREVPKGVKINCVTQFMGYQTVNESLQWLRIELRYGKNAPHSNVKTLKMDNPQPSS